MKFVRKICSICLVVLLLCTTAVSVFASDDIRVKLDGKPISFDVAPRIINDRTMVPLRAIFEALGATVIWDGETQTVTSTKNHTTIILTINHSLMYVNGKGIVLDSPACLIDGRTLVPLRAVSEAFGTDVEWVDSERTVLLTTSSHYYLDGVSVDDVITYFGEVCLDSEYSVGATSTPNLIHKWEEPVYYCVYGTPTQKDLIAIEELALQLNSIDGFPGFYPGTAENCNTAMYFCSSGELINRLGSNFNSHHYGGFVYRYSNHAIYDGVICCRNDIPQDERISVIKEEIYGVLGPAQDTVLRQDSILYQYSNSNLELSDMDLLILELLYHPDIKVGMNYEQCAQVIKTIYHP